MPIAKCDRPNETLDIMILSNVEAARASFDCLSDPYCYDRRNSRPEVAEQLLATNKVVGLGKYSYFVGDSVEEVRQKVASWSKSSGRTFRIFTVIGGEDYGK